MKTVLFVPGFQENFRSRDYKSTLEAIKNEGYIVKFVPINWKRTVIDDWVEQLEQVYGAYEAENTILAGFSYGSLTAFVTATKRNPSELWLFSFSPYFADDIPRLKQSWLNGIGKRRTQAFGKLDFKSLTNDIQCKTLLFVGGLEAKKYPLIARRANLAQEHISGAQLHKVHNVGHDVGHKNYIDSIKSAIRKGL